MIDLTLDEALVEYKTWILSDGKMGHVNQSVGVAKAVGFENPRIVELEKRKFGSFLNLIYPGLGVKNLPSAPFPDVVIAAGNLTAPVARWIKSQSPSTFLMQIMKPAGDLSLFDVIAVPVHDKLKSSNNIVQTIGAPNKITPELMDEASAVWKPKLEELKAPYLGVLIGGETKHFTFGESEAISFAENLINFAKEKGFSLLVSTSRRTNKKVSKIIRERIAASGIDNYFWDPIIEGVKGDNPYLGILSLSDGIVVTADSVSMVSESCTAGKPTMVYGIKAGMGKMDDLYRALFAHQLISKFEDKKLLIAKEPLADTIKVAGFIRGKLLQKILAELPEEI